MDQVKSETLNQIEQQILDVGLGPKDRAMGRTS